jgi:glucose-1-phosphate cytidylyltransferase
MGKNVKVVILCGGMGTRISEETERIPKPMIEIGGKPILWHIMKTYSHYGFNDFILCLGYKGYIIKEYFSHYFMHMSDVTIDMRTNTRKIHSTASEPWKVTMVDTGPTTMTGGRLLRVKKYVQNSTFMMTYGDGVGDINIKKLLTFHKQHKKAATITAIQPTGRFGALDIKQGGQVDSFFEKPSGDGSWVNGGYFVLEPKIFESIIDDSSVWEREPLEQLSEKRELMAYKHSGFWKPMDTLRDKVELETMWQSKKAVWNKWESK